MYRLILLLLPFITLHADTLHIWNTLNAKKELCSNLSFFYEGVLRLHKGSSEVFYNEFLLSTKPAEWITVNSGLRAEERPGGRKCLVVLCDASFAKKFRDFDLRLRVREQVSLNRPGWLERIQGRIRFPKIAGFATPYFLEELFFREFGPLVQYRTAGGVSWNYKELSVATGYMYRGAKRNKWHHENILTLTAGFQF